MCVMVIHHTKNYQSSLLRLHVHQAGSDITFIAQNRYKIPNKVCFTDTWTGAVSSVQLQNVLTQAHPTMLTHLSSKTYVVFLLLKQLAATSDKEPEYH